MGDMQQPGGDMLESGTVQEPESPYAFISYRSLDRRDVRALRGQLEGRFPGNRFWIDKADLPAGQDFAPNLQRGIQGCNVVVAAIGPGWVDRVSDLHDPEDFVRKEILWAQEYGKPVIPAMLHTQVPDDLPEDVAPIFVNNGVFLNDVHWEVIIDSQLVPALEPLLVPSFSTERKRAEERAQAEAEAAAQEAEKADQRRRTRHRIIVGAVWLVVTALMMGVIHVVKSSQTSGIIGAGPGDVVPAALVAAVVAVIYHFVRRK